MKRENNTARRWFGLPGLTMLIAAVAILNSCGYENVTPGASHPVVVEGDPIPDPPKPPKDGHGGGRGNGETPSDSTQNNR